MTKMHTAQFFCLDSKENGTITASEDDLIEHPVVLIDGKLFLRNHNERENSFMLVEVLPLVARPDAA